MELVKERERGGENWGQGWMVLKTVVKDVYRRVGVRVRAEWWAYKEVRIKNWEGSCVTSGGKVSEGCKAHNCKYHYLIVRIIEMTENRMLACAGKESYSGLAGATLSGSNKVSLYSWDLACPSFLFGGESESATTN